MATFNVSGLSTYKNQIDGEIFTGAVLPKAVVASGIDVISGVKGTQSLNFMDDTFYLQTGGCGIHTNSGSTTFTQRDLSVCSLKLERDFCPSELNTYWMGAKFRPGSKYEDLDFMQGTVLSYIENKLAETNELIIWQGESGGSNADPNLNLCDGFLEVISGATTRITTGTTSLTAANIIANIDLMINVIPERILTRDLVLYVSPSIYRMYLQAMKAANYYHMFGEIDSAMKMKLPVFGNITMWAQSGLVGTSKVVLTYADNLVLGTDLEDENDKVEIWYSQDYNSVKTRAQYKLGTQVKYPAYIVTNF